MNDAIAKNAAFADEYKHLGNVILAAQLEECVRQLAKEHKTLTATETSAAFACNFGKDVISPLFLEFCKCIKQFGFLKPVYTALPSAVPTVSHMQNANSFSALSILCNSTDVRSVTERDFRSCCESVVRGTADYCVLPMSSTDDGVFPSFHKLLKAFDLKICRVCTVTCSDREAEMRFSLLGRRLEHTQTSRNIVFSFLPDEDQLSSLIAALHGAGCTIEEINSLPTEFSIDKIECTVWVRCNELDASVLLFFLEAALPGHTILGIY